MLVRFAYQYWFNGSNVYQHQRFPQVTGRHTQREGVRHLIWNHMKIIIISGQGENREDWNTNSGLDVIMEKQDTDILDCVPLIDLSIADWHMSLSFLPFINLRFFSICSQHLIWHSSTYFRYGERRNHLFPIESNLKFHLIKSLLYIIFKFQRSIFFRFFLFNAEWMWVQHQSQSHFIWL